MLDFETLRFIWWLLLGVLFIGFAITDGFDFGAAFLSPFVARTEAERRIVLNTIGPFWEGNQVWIILGAGAIFAAWPPVYAVTFSGFYLLVLFLLLTMGISRPVSFKYRSKLPNHFWRRFWDWVVFIGGLFPALIFGLLIGNALLGVPFYFDNNLMIIYSGTFFGLFQPFAILCALASLFMLAMHGGLYLAIKTENPIKQRAVNASRLFAVLLIFAFATGGYYLANSIMGYQIVGGVDPYGYSNPLHKSVTLAQGAWLQNYRDYPLLYAAPILGFAGAVGVLLFASVRNGLFAFCLSSLSIVGVIGSVGISMFPFILPSSNNLSSSLLVWDASSSQLTLLIMLFAVLIFMPIILIYTSWAYYVLRGKVRQEEMEAQAKQHVAY